METLRETVSNHKTELTLGALGITGLTLMGMYGMKQYKLSHAKHLDDNDFKEQNLPLYKEEALERSRLLEDV